MAYLKTVDVTNYIFLQIIDFARSQLLSYAIDSDSNKLYSIRKNLFTSDVGIFFVAKSDFQYNKITSSVDSFYLQINLLSNNYST